MACGLFLSCPFVSPRFTSCSRLAYDTPLVFLWKSTQTNLRCFPYTTRTVFIVKERGFEVEDGSVICVSEAVVVYWLDVLCGEWATL